MEIEVELEVELELVRVTPLLGRRDRASSTALCAWDTAEAIDLERSSNLFVFSRAIDVHLPTFSEI